MSTIEIFESASKLRPDERLKLIDALYASLDQPDPAIETAWLHEARDRLAAYERGELEAKPIEELLVKHRET
jgi:putative addiction module component (TIGR02574 family)